MKKSFVASALPLLLFSLVMSSCGRIDSSFQSNEQFINQPSFTSFGFESPSIEDFIKKNTIADTEWGTNVKVLPVSKNVKKATLLSYLAFDNDKGSWRQELKPMINVHEQAGSSSSLNLVLQSDGAEKQDLKRYYVVNDQTEDYVTSPYTSFKYERDSADFRVLRSFIRWGFSTYKSQYKILDINNHGGAFNGIALDEESRNMISLPNLNRAIKEAAGRLDIMTFDACLMATVETGYELKDTASVMIGSEDSTLGTGMLYAKNLTDIIAKALTPEEIAKSIVLSSDRFGKELYRRTNKKGKVANVFTISAFRGPQMNDVAQKLNVLAKILLNPKYKNAVKVALDGTHPFYIDEDGSQGQRDLYEVLERVDFIIKDSAVKEAVNETRKALNKAIIISRSHKVEKYAKGMAINIAPHSVSSSDYQATRFAKDTAWDELVVQTYK